MFKKKSVWIIALLFCAGIVWWAQVYNDLWRHIMPGTFTRLSTSSARYDITLRVASKGGKLLDEGVPPMEWKLRLPRKFVTSEIGTNGVTYRRTPGGGDEYFVDFQVLVSEDGKTFIPTAGKSPKEQRVRSMIFHMRNKSAIPAIRDHVSCVPEHMRKIILEAKGFKPSFNGNCYEQSLRCTIDMHVDGWDIDLAVTKELYATPEIACGLARQFLQEHTVKRDDIR